MTSASELWYQRRSRVGRDYGLEPSSSSDHHLDYINHRRHRRTVVCTTGRSPQTRRHLRVHASPSVRSDVSASQLIPDNGASTENLRNTGRPRFNPNDRLPGAVLLARARLLERLGGMALPESRSNSRALFSFLNRERLSGNELRAIDSGDWGTEQSSGWYNGVHVDIFSTIEIERVQFFQGSFKNKPPGLSSEELELLQSEMFSSLENDAKGEGVSHMSCDCSICLESYAEGDKLIHLPCRHRFHFACLEPWVRTCGNCPYCRMVISFE